MKTNFYLDKNKEKIVLFINNEELEQDFTSLALYSNGEKIPINFAKESFLKNLIELTINSMVKLKEKQIKKDFDWIISNKKLYSIFYNKMLEKEEYEILDFLIKYKQK